MAKFHSLKVSDLQKETEDCTSIAFEVPKEIKANFAFKQGQYLTMRTQIEGQEVRRSYSICSGPSDGELRVAVKQVPEGLFSTFANHNLLVGDTLDVMPPMGKFYTELSAQQSKKYLGVAAGSGITPIISIIKAVLETEAESSFVLLYGNQYISTVIFKEQIEALKNKYLGRLQVFHFFSKEISEFQLFSGRVSGEKIEQLQGKVLDFSEMEECFICGPEEMIFSVKDTLEKIGVPKKAIHFELFTTAGSKKIIKKKVQKSENKERVCLVQVKDGGNSFQFSLPFDTKNILDAAMDRGADLPYACKAGVCCTCKAKVTEGEVEMLVNYALEPEEVEAGYVLSCQCFPKSDKVVIDFDEAL